MGRSHKRSQKSLKRTSGKKPPTPSILIVCEGQKTEKIYFTELAHDLKLLTTDVAVEDLGSVSSPDRIWKYAKELYEKTYINYKKKEGHSKKLPFCYEHVYCVIDRDQHPSYQTPIEQAKCYRPKHKDHIIKLIPSIPCFELWLLLHFERTTKNYYGHPSKSPCQNLIDSLKALPEMSGYSSNRKPEDIYQNSKLHLSKAQENSRQVLAQSSSTGASGSRTYVHELTEFLLSI